MGAVVEGVEAVERVAAAMKHRKTAVGELLNRERKEVETDKRVEGKWMGWMMGWLDGWMIV